MQIKKIMLVDDEPISNIISKKILLNHNPELIVSDYTDPAIAMEAFPDVKPDIIFLDINMPEMNGWAFLDALANQGINLPVILLTSSTSDADLAKSQEYPNVLQLFHKPLKIDTIGALMDSISR